MATIEQLMKRIQKRSGGGKVVITLPETGRDYVAHVYPSREQIDANVRARFEKAQQTSVSLTELDAAIVAEGNQTLAYGRGKTIEEALDDLGRKIGGA